MKVQLTVEVDTVDSALVKLQAEDVRMIVFRTLIACDDIHTFRVDVQED